MRLGLAVLLLATLGGAEPAFAASELLWFQCGHGGVAACTQILKLRDEPAESHEYALVYRGDAQLAANNLDAAAADYRAALAEPAPLAHAAYGMGMVAKARSDWPAAVAAFSQAAASTAEDADAGQFSYQSVLGNFRQEPLAELGFALYRSGQPQAALDALAKAVAVSPTSPVAPRYQSFVLTGMHRLPEAIAAAERAIALDPMGGGGFFARGLARAAAGDESGALSDQNEALLLTPELTLASQARDQALARGAVVAPSTAGAGAIAALAASAPLDAADLRALFTGRSWRASQGVWRNDLELRSDGSLHQTLVDGKLSVVSDGAWTAVGNQLCLFTNRKICVSVHGDAARIVLTGEHGEVEMTGSRADLKPYAGDNASNPIREFPLDEQFIAGTRPAGAKPSLLYYIHGFAEHARAHAPALEYFLGHLAHAEHMDVIDADYPVSLAAGTEPMLFEATNYGNAAFLARRLRELKRQGYEHIFVGGQSWGGWTSFVLSLDAGLPLDGTILIVPCGFLPPIAGDQQNNQVDYNTLLFHQFVGQVHYPMLGLFFQWDFCEVADRGENAKAVLDAHHVPRLIINHPPGFFGHGAGWEPAFDAIYGACIDAFIGSPHTFDCKPRPLLTRDWRALFTAHRFPPNWRDMTLGLGDVQGRSFIVYPEGDTRKVIDAASSATNAYGPGSEVVSSRFQNGDYCWRDRPKYLQAVSTDEQCLALIKWSDHVVIGLDRKSGSVREWWIETP